MIAPSLVGERPSAQYAGTCALLPRGSEHSYSVESAEARLLVVVAPGLEEFYGEQCRYGTASGIDVERLVTMPVARQTAERKGWRSP